jgi:hypothetical protein
MLNRIFPKQIDNAYRGYQLALWLLVLFLLAKTFASVTQIGLNPLWTNRDVLQGVERVPLDAFSANAVDPIIVLFAWWGVTGLMPTVLGLIAVVRYRAMIPLLYLMMATNKIGEQVLVEVSPVAGMLGEGAPMPVIAIAVLLIGFGMSVTTPRKLESVG